MKSDQRLLRGVAAQLLMGGMMSALFVSVIILTDVLGIEAMICRHRFSDHDPDHILRRSNAVLRFRGRDHGLSLSCLRRRPGPTGVRFLTPRNPRKTNDAPLGSETIQCTHHPSSGLLR
jgi:hypothetical protein